MASDDLASLDAVKGWLDLNDPSETEDDALLAGLITAASGFIRRWCGRAFTSQGVTEIRDGTGGRRLSFLQTPAFAVQSLVIDGRVIPAGDATLTPGYYFSETAISLNGYCFARGLGNVALAYTAGFDPLPADLVQACVELVGCRYRERDRIGLVSKGMVGETTQFVQSEMTPFVHATLAAYKRVVPL